MAKSVREAIGAALHKRIEARNLGMSEPQHPTPFGGHAGNQPGAHQGAEGNPAAAPASAGQAGRFESIAAVGARLAQLREAKAWSLDDVSARLKVPPHKLRALEAGDLSHLPDRTFAAGIVRSYAKILGADPAPFTEALRRESGPPEQAFSLPESSGAGLPRARMARMSVPLGGSSRRRSWMWGIAALVVALVALAMWHTGGDSAAWLARLKGGAGSAPVAASATAEASPASTPDEIAAANTGDAPGTGVQPMPSPLGTNALPASSPVTAGATGASVPLAPAVNLAASAAANATASAAAAASEASVAGEGSSAVEMKVKQDSWLSVRQKDGKEVFSGLVHAGSVQRVEGEPPFKVTVGNVAGVESLTVDDQPVDPKRYSGARGNVARLTLP
jgi:cytoskeleton protein RodZ